MKYLIQILLMVMFFSVNASLVSAQTGAEVTTEAAQDSKTANPLSINMVNPVSEREIDIVFSEPVALDSVRVTVENSLTRENVKVVNYTQAMAPTTVRVLLDTNLLQSTTYKLTINTAISLKNETITAGVDAIREFVTPVQFTQDEETLPLDAASNEGAIVAPTPETTETPVTVETSEMPAETATGATPEATELPATGPSSLIFLTIAVIGAVAIMASRRRSA